MTFVCPYSHISYADWHFQVIRGLFCSSHPQRAWQRTASRYPYLSYRIGEQCNFTASAAAGRGRGKSKKKNHGDDGDAFAFLEEAARRTTTAQVVDPSLYLRSDTSSSGQSKEDLHHKATDTTSGGTAGKMQKNDAAKTPRKTKQHEEEDDGAFPKEATKRVTGQRTPGQLRATYEQRNGSYRGARTQEQIEAAENIALLEDISKHINYGRMFDLLKVYTQSLPSNSSAPTMPKQIVKEVDSSLQEPTKRVNHERALSLPTAPARPTEDIAGSKENTIQARLSTGDLNPNHNSRPNGTRKNSTSRPETQAFQDELWNSSPAEVLQNWFNEFADGTREHERDVETSGANRVHCADSRETTRKENHRSLEPGKFGAQKRAYSTRRPENDPIKDSLHDDFGPQRSLLGADANLETQNSPDHVDLGYHIDEQTAIEAKTRTTSDSVCESTVISLSKAEDPTLLFKGDLLRTANVLEDRNSSPVPAGRKPLSGVLSSLEHEQLYSLLSTLRSRKMDNKMSEQKPEVKSIFESLPSSPYEHLQAKKGLMKVQPTAEGKRRLRDNPWAELLASPVRMCRATSVRLPKQLMVGWNFVKNPKDGKVYLMPEELTDMTHLDPGSRTSSLSGKSSHGGKPQRIATSGPAVKGNLREPTIIDGSLRAPNEAEQGDGSQSSTELISSSEPLKGKPSTGPPKIYIRPSSILLLELSKTMRATRAQAKDNTSSMLPTVTRPGAINALLPHRWRDQADISGKSMDAKTHQAGILTKQDLGKVQWHPNIHVVMLNLLRSRVLKALESTAVRNSYHTGICRRIIPLHLAESDSHDAKPVTTTSFGIEQAVFLWLGAEESSESAPRNPQTTQHQPSPSPPISPLTCGLSTLRFVPCPLPAESHPSSSPDARDNPEQAFTLVWTHAPATSTPAQPLQDQYIPPSITLHLPDSNTDTRSTTRTLPVFDLQTLLGDASISKLHTLAETSPAVADAFGLPNNGTHSPSGWVMVKGGNGVKTLVHELWRLWLFVGGRRWGLDEE